MERVSRAADDPMVVSIPWPDYYGGLRAELPFWPLQVTAARLTADVVYEEPSAPTGPWAGLGHTLAALLARWQHRAGGRQRAEGAPASEA